MSISANSLVVLSANCQGLRDFKKRVDVINYFKETGAHIICLQDTHLTDNDKTNFYNIWSGTFYLHGQNTNSRGVAVLFSNTFDFQVKDVNTDRAGNFLQLVIETYNTKINLVNIYAPNLDNPNFYRSVENLVAQSNSDLNIICGDYNLIMDPTKDCQNYKHLNNPKAREIVLEIIETYKLVDVFRFLHPDEKKYTWRRKNPLKQARLDFFLISDAATDLVEDCSILPSYRSDHSSSVEVTFFKI